MNILSIVLQHAEAAGEAPNVFNLSLGTSFWTVAIFLILMAVLAKFAFPAILGYAEAREKRIQQALDEARTAREEAQALIEEQRRQMADARQQAQQVIAESKQAAERVRQEILDRARTEQEEMLERARQEIERERVRAVDAIRREAVEVAIAAAGKLVHERLGAEEDRRIVSQYIDRIGAEGAGVA